MQKNSLTNLLDEITRENKVNQLFLERYKNKLSPKFSIFNYFLINELVLSNILADLLNPAGSHGQGSLFIKIWIELNEKILNENWKNIDFDQSNSQVKLEEKNWRLGTLRRMDILIEIKTQDKTFALCIENKPFAADQKDQLNDYAAELEKRYGDQWHLIYLSGQGQSPTETSISNFNLKQFQEKKQLSVLGYADLIEWLNKSIIYTENERVRGLLVELKVYVYHTFITRFNNEEQAVMLKTIIDNNDYIKAVIEVETLKAQLQESLLSKFKNDLSQLCDGFVIDGELTSKAYSGISIYRESLSKKIRFRVEFDRTQFGVFFLGIILSDFKNVVLTSEERQKIYDLVQENFPSTKIGQSPNWPVFIEIPELVNWHNDGDIWVRIKDGSLATKIYNEFFLPLNEIIEICEI